MESESTPPDWLNAEFLKSALANELKTDNFLINKYEIQQAVPKGDHFASSLHRVALHTTYLNENRGELKAAHHLIIKSLPTGEIMRQMVSEAGTFEREADVYLFILPAMYNLEQEVLGNSKQYFTSRCIYCKSDVLILEDLRHLGYSMADRRNGLDVSHCTVALKSLARFHALSIALHCKNMARLSDFKEIFYKEERRPILEKYFRPGINSLASVVEKWNGYEHFGEKLRKLAENATDKIIDVVKPSPHCLSVLNHGDFWVNNILFRYSEETNVVQDSKFVDFQIARYSSPALDLQYFLNTSPTEDVRSNHIEELLELYHKELRNILDSLGCEEIVFTLEQLKKEFNDRAVFGVITACTLLHLVLADPKDKDATDDDLSGVEANAMEKGFSGALFRNQFQKLLLFYEDKQWL